MDNAKFLKKLQKLVEEYENSNNDEPVGCLVSLPEMDGDQYLEWNGANFQRTVIVSVRGVLPYE